MPFVPNLGFGLARIKNRILGRAKRVYSSADTWRGAPYAFRLDLYREDADGCFADLSFNGRVFMLTTPQLRHLRSVLDDALGVAEAPLHDRDGGPGQP